MERLNIYLLNFTALVLVSLTIFTTFSYNNLLEDIDDLKARVLLLEFLT
jgi:hypothetical protein